MSAEKVKRFLQEMRAVQGALYGWWKPLAGADHLPYDEPMYTRGKYSAEYIKKNDVNCTGLGNQALGRMGVPIPKDPSGYWWTGGTAAWFRGVNERRPVTESEIERGVPVGTVVVGDYIDAFNQGHFAVVSTPKKNGRQLCIQSDDIDPGPGTPGVTEKRTLRETVDLTRSISKGGAAYFGEVPGIGVMDGSEEDSDDRAGRGKEGRTDGPVTGSFDVVDLREAMSTLPLGKAQGYFPHLVAAMREAEITTRLRACHFLAQLGHESVDLLHMQELGGAGYFTRLYEGRGDLGNTQRGDGARYHGRGPIQLTGRANYRAAGRDLGLDLERNPERAAEPEVAFRIAGWYWTTRNLNKFSDLGDAGVDDVTRLINGGYNGLDDRKKRYFNCKKVLPENFSIGRGGQGGDMSFQKVIMAHATHEDGVLAHEAAAVLHRHDIKCTVADAGNMKAAIAACQSEKVGWGDFVVIGQAAKDMFPSKLKKYIGETVRRSDYRDAVGEDVEDTADKLARVLDGIASRKDVSGDLRREFEEAASLVEVRRGANNSRGQGSDEEVEDQRPSSNEDYENGGRSRDERSGERRRGRTRAANGRETERDEDDGSVQVRPDELTDEDLEEIGREALEFFSTIRKLTGQGRS